MRFKLITILISVILAGFFATNIAQAQAVPFFGEAKNICELIKNVFYFGVSLAGIAAVLVIAIGGIIYMVSFGSEEKKKVAMDLMGGALKGLLLALFSWTIFYIINPYLLKCKVPELGVELPDLCADYPDKIYNDEPICEKNCPSETGFCYPAKEAGKYCCVSAVTPSCAGATKTFNDEDECKKKGECLKDICWLDATMSKWCCMSYQPSSGAPDPCWDKEPNEIYSELECKSMPSPCNCLYSEEKNDWCCSSSCLGLERDFKMTCLQGKLKLAAGCPAGPGRYEGLEQASPKLLDFLDCMAETLRLYKKAGLPVNDHQDFRITSIMDCDHSACNYENNGCNVSGGCSHRCNSYHYGGPNCEDGSYAVDWSILGNPSTVKRAAEACGAYVLEESDHHHISIGQQNGCGTSKY